MPSRTKKRRGLLRVLTRYAPLWVPSPVVTHYAPAPLARPVVRYSVPPTGVLPSPGWAPVVTQYLPVVVGP